MFSKFGEIISIDISKKITFQPNAGSAYIVMKVDSDASKAVKALSNTELLGSRIIVTDAHTIDQKGHKYYYSQRRRR
jgi:RNA recognition motif-containing protein